MVWEESEEMRWFNIIYEYFEDSAKEKKKMMQETTGFLK